MSEGVRCAKLYSTRKACALVLLVACFGFSPAACGQEVTAAITGRVADPTGASIVGAALIAKDTERGTVYTVLTNSVGVF